MADRTPAFLPLEINFYKDGAGPVVGPGDSRLGSKSGVVCLGRGVA
jgi:hypothetical protein